MADVTVAGTEIAMDTVAGFGFTPKSFVEGGGFLKYVEIGHGASRQDHYTRTGDSGRGLRGWLIGG